MRMATQKTNNKSAAAFRTISEVSEELDVPQHVLRFWETKFSQVRPLKRGGGRRYYRPEDIDLLRRIRKLLYTDGFTIKGVQKLLREGMAMKVADEVTQPPSSKTDAMLENGDRAQVKAVLDDLLELRNLVRKALN
jgi:DNA-binding transcriptional MerR regulator